MNFKTGDRVYWRYVDIYGRISEIQKDGWYWVRWENGSTYQIEEKELEKAKDWFIFVS